MSDILFDAAVVAPAAIAVAIILGTVALLLRLRDRTLRSATATRRAFRMALVAGFIVFALTTLGFGSVAAAFDVPSPYLQAAAIALPVASGCAISVVATYLLFARSPTDLTAPTIAGIMGPLLLGVIVVVGASLSGVLHDAADHVRTADAAAATVARSQGLSIDCSAAHARVIVEPSDSPVFAGQLDVRHLDLHIRLRSASPLRFESAGYVSISSPADLAYKMAPVQIVALTMPASVPAGFEGTFDVPIDPMPAAPAGMGPPGRWGCELHAWDPSELLFEVDGTFEIPSAPAP